MSTITTAITTIITASVSWVSTAVGMITAEGNELLLFMILFGFVGTGIGLIKRLVNVN